MTWHSGRRIRYDAAGGKPLQKKSADSPVPLRVQRLFRLLHCVEAPEMFTAQGLASALGVSRRTIFRDLNLLRDAGINIHFNPATSCYSLMPDPKLQRPLLNERDLTVLGLAVRLSLVHAIPELAVAAQEALAILLGSREDPGQSEAIGLANYCQLDLTDLAPPAIASHVVLEICRALRLGRQIRVTFNDFEGAGPQLLLTPEQVVASARRWELVGLATVEQRIVRVDLAQIQRVELADEVLATPSVPDPLDWLAPPQLGHADPIS